MSVEVIRNEYIIVRATDSIDVSTVHEFRRALEGVLDESPKTLIIDLRDALYADSAGLQAIVYAYQRMRSWGGRLALVVANPSMKEIIDIMHFEALPGVFVCDSLECAEQALTGRE